MPDLVISNTSPLFYLHRLRHLDLLQKLYQLMSEDEVGTLRTLTALKR
jgi:hypothetical protein